MAAPAADNHANGQPISVPFYMHVDYEIEPFLGIKQNTPPVIRFDPKGPSVQGPLNLVGERTASVGKPLELAAFADDDAVLPNNNARPPANRDPVTIAWAKYRGTGEVKIEKDKPKLEKVEGATVAFSGKSSTTATFSEPGEYWLQATLNDYSGTGGGGFLCCWTTGLLKVTVK